jgi:hypothetical protein
VDHTPLAVCLLDHDRKVAVTSREYVMLAERNNGALPTVGESWKHPPKSLSLLDDKGEEQAYKLEQIQLPKDGTDVMFLLRPK